MQELETTTKPGACRWCAAGLLSAAALGAAYVTVRRQSARAERDHPPAGQFLDIDGVRLHYFEHGTGPVVVLLHGNVVMADDFRRAGLVGRLAESYRVIAFDRPGFGYSSRPDGVIWTPDAQARLLHKALRQLGAGDYLVLAHSWGTLVALAMALQEPRLVRGLVLLSGYYYPGARLDVPLAALPALPVVGNVLRHTVSPLLGRVVWPLSAKAMFSPAEVPDSFRGEPPWMLLRPSQVHATAAEAALMVPAAMALEGRYAQLRMPVTLLAGGGDRVMDPHAQTERLHKVLPDSELVLLPEMGHMLPHLAQEEIVQAVNRTAARAGMEVPAALDGAAADGARAEETPAAPAS